MTSSPGSASEFSEESLFAGRLSCRQPRRGYRYSLDAVLLAHFLVPKRRDRILDLCAGCGIVSLLLAYRWPEIRLTALEVQPRLAGLIRENSETNGLSGRMEAVTGDCRRIGELLAPGSFDCLVCNPPYRRLASGRQNPHSEEAIARHELRADLETVLAAAAHALRTGGRAVFVYPAARAASLLAGLAAHAFAAKRLRVVHSHPGDQGRLVLVEAAKNGGEGLTILPPLHVYQHRGGEYTAEMAAFYAP